MSQARNGRTTRRKQSAQMSLLATKSGKKVWCAFDCSKWLNHLELFWCCVEIKKNNRPIRTVKLCSADVADWSLPSEWHGTARRVRKKTVNLNSKIVQHPWRRLIVAIRTTRHGTARQQKQKNAVNLNNKIVQHRCRRLVDAIRATQHGANNAQEQAKKFISTARTTR